MDDVKKIYINKFVNYYIDEYDEKTFIYANNNDLWELYVINYKDWCRKFGLNPNYHKNEKEIQYFIAVINKIKEKIK